MKKLLSALLALALLVGPVAPAFATVNAQTGTTYTFLNTDCDPNNKTVVTFNNAASVAVTLPAAGASGAFVQGCTIQAQNIGLGVVTITPTTSTINGGVAILLQPGTSTTITPDASPITGSGNYWAQTGGGGNSGPNPLNFRNVLDNGNMALSQRSEASAIACGGTTGTTTANGYGPDRWACIVNVGSQVGKIQTVTASPAPPTGFKQSVTVWRNSAALTQPVCLFQEVPFADSLSLAGQQATFSEQLQALGSTGSLAASAVTMYIMTGTAANGDQGMATMTASPAVTPAWTGIASTTNKAVTLTAAWQKFSVSGLIPAAATEIAVATCYTPSGTAGATDGFAAVGSQLEQGYSPTAYEFKPAVIEQVKAEYYYYQLTEGTAAQVVAECNDISVTLAACFVPFPVAMRAVPAITTTTGFAVNTTTAYSAINNCSAFVLNATSTTPKASLTGAPVTCTATTVPAAGTANQLWSNAGTGSMSASADF